MTAIVEFDRANLQVLRSEITAALKAVGDKYGVTFVAGNGSYSPGRATLKVEMSIGAGQDASVVRIGKEADALVAHQKVYFPDLKLDAVYINGNKTYSLVGYNTRARKTPMLVKCLEDGKVYRTSEDWVRRCKVQ